MAKTREREAVAPSAAYFDPQDFPPHKLNDDEAQASAGRLSDVDPDYAPEGSDARARSEERDLEDTVAPVPDPRDEPEESEEAVEALEEAEAEEAEVDAEVEDLEDPEELTIPQLQAELNRRNVEFDKYARKPELVELVTEARANA
jgi:hypothetical protein